MRERLVTMREPVGDALPQQFIEVQIKRAFNEEVRATIHQRFQGLCIHGFQVA
jgi:hypothetical protein